MVDFDVSRIEPSGSDTTVLFKYDDYDDDDDDDDDDDNDDDDDDDDDNMLLYQRTAIFRD
jgi:hypothetical protein